MMKQTILLVMAAITFSACKQQPKCDNPDIKKTVMELYTPELKAAIAWEYYYIKIWHGTENDFAVRLQWESLRTISMMQGESLPDIETAIAMAKEDIYLLSKGEAAKTKGDYKKYLNYADSILSLGNIHMEQIMLDAAHPDLQKCECKAILSFEKQMKLKDQEILYDIQITTEGESIVTIYQLRQEILY